MGDDQLSHSVRRKTTSRKKKHHFSMWAYPGKLRFSLCFFFSLFPAKFLSIRGTAERGVGKKRTTAKIISR